MRRPACRGARSARPARQAAGPSSRLFAYMPTCPVSGPAAQNNQFCAYDSRPRTISSPRKRGWRTQLASFVPVRRNLVMGFVGPVIFSDDTACDVRAGRSMPSGSAASPNDSRGPAASIARSPGTCALSVLTRVGRAGEQPFQFAASLVAPGVCQPLQLEQVTRLHCASREQVSCA